ncbi:MAG: hypothetical protein JNN27_00790 [Planctomycetes bacterium]|nr:hypothetical protein [Planctomycetota bacterium]
MTPRITAVVFTPSSTRRAADGLVGWLRIQVDGWLEIDSVTLRRTSRGELQLSFPSKVDGVGYRRYVVRPIDPQVRSSIHAQVVEWLRRERGVAS